MLKILPTLAAVVLVLTGCSNGSAEPGDTGASATPVTVKIRIAGDTITPNGDRIKVAVGQTVTLKVHSDRAGELHVHATPEQHLEYSKGDTTEQVTIDQPGIVDIEDHKADIVVVQLEVGS